MNNYEIRVTQICRDYYRLEAKDAKDAEQKLMLALSTGIMGNIDRNDTIDCAPKIDYTVPLSPEGEVIL